MRLSDYSYLSSLCLTKALRFLLLVQYSFLCTILLYDVLLCLLREVRQKNVIKISTNCYWEILAEGWPKTGSTALAVFLGGVAVSRPALVVRGGYGFCLS